MATKYKEATTEEQVAELERLRLQGGLDVVKDRESGYFKNGSTLARTEHLPWTPFVLEGSKFKLLAIDWKRDMYMFMLIVPGGIPVSTHYHLSEAYGYIMSGSFEYEFGNVFAGDFVGEGEDIEHGAVIGAEEVLQVSTIFGGLTGVAPNGGPDLESYVGCMEVYKIAMDNHAAYHITPPPPGWTSSILETAKARFL